MNLAVRQCLSCGAPLPKDSDTCLFCGTVHEKVVEREIDPFYMDHDFQEKLLQTLGKAAKANPHDLQSQYGMGLVFLSRAQYKRAQQCLKKAIDAKPNDADVYYYYAMSLCEAEPLTQIPAETCEEIRECLQASLSIERKRKYLILAMLFRQGAYIGKGKALRKGESSPAKLLEEALQIAGDDERTMQEIDRFLCVDDKVCRQMLDKVRQGTGQTGRTSGAGESTILRETLEKMDDLCQRPKGAADAQTSDENVRRLTDTQVRADFFRTLYEPQLPKMESLPSLFKTIAAYGSWIVFLLLMIPIMNFYVWDFSVYEKERQMSHLPVEEHLERMYGDYEKREFYSKQDKKKFLQNVERERERYDSILQVKRQKDSTFLADYRQVFYTYVLDKEEYKVDEPFTTAVLDTLSPNAYHVVAHAQIEDKVAMGRFLKALPAYLLLILLVYVVYKNFNTRKALKQLNAERRRQYNQEMSLWAERPTVEDYKRFCQLYLGPNTGLVAEGDIVQRALDALKLTDGSFNKGKLFFSNFFVDSAGSPAERGAKAEDVLAHMRVVVAVATGNSIKVMTGIWHTAQDEPIRFNTQNIYYTHIQSIKKTQDLITLVGSHGTRLAEIPIRGGGFGNLFCYQSLDSSDKLTYSETRTSDEVELERALDSIIAENQH